MYYPDLTPYEYLWDDDPSSPNHEQPRPLNIGWLDELHPFPRGSVPADLLTKLLRICESQMWNLSLGFHKSPFSDARSYAADLDGRKVLLGSAEVRVPGKNGRVYAAPDLIYHYIKDAGYLPPAEFIDALRGMPEP